MANNAKIFLFTIISGILIYLDALQTEIYSLYIINIDEYVFHGSLLRILARIKNFDLRIFFGTGFFNYGFLYFFSVFGVTSPFLIFEHSNFSVIIPRLFSSFFALGSLNLIFKIFRLKSSVRIIFLLPIILLVSSLAFWFNAIVFHPDWPYAFFILYSVYFLFKDENSLGRNFYLSIIAFSIAFSLKIQAIIYFPIIFLYVISIVNFKLKPKFKILICVLVFILISRIVTNPYLLHPEGLEEFIQGFKADMLSNKTNHGGADVTFLDKIKMLHNWYFNIVLLILSLIILINRLYQYLFKKDYSLINQLSITILVNLAYLLFFVNKAWQNYYLPCFTLIIILLHFFILEKYPKRYLIFFSVFICLNIGLQFEFFYESIYKFKFYQNKDLSYFKSSNLVLRKYVKPNDNILVVGQGVVDFSELGLKYENIHFVSGKFETRHLLNYNNHYPGKKIIKNFVIVSKLCLSEADLVSEEKILHSYYKIADSPHFILYSLFQAK
jgi:hypothetical protein